MKVTSIIGSKDVARAAINISMTVDREDEKQLINELKQNEIYAAAVDCGGDFISSISKLLERAIVAAKREGVIGDQHNEQGAVAGAAHEAIEQIMPKAVGFNFGGKIGIARCGDQVAVAMFFGIGLLHLNEISIGLGHRAI